MCRTGTKIGSVQIYSSHMVLLFFFDEIIELLII